MSGIVQCYLSLPGQHCAFHPHTNHPSLKAWRTVALGKKIIVTQVILPCRRSSGADTIQRQWSRFTENCRAFLVIQSPITCTCLFWMPMRSDQLVNRVQAWFIVLISLLFSSASKVSLVPLILHVTRTVVRLLCVSNDYKK